MEEEKKCKISKLSKSQMDEIEEEDDLIITDYSKFKEENIIFSKVTKGEIPEAGHKIFYRIYIDYQYDNGTIDSLVIKTPIVSSLGIQENYQFSTQPYIFPLILQEGDNDSHDGFIELLEKIVRRIRKHLNRTEVKRKVTAYDINKRYVNNDLHIIYWKKENGERVPMIYAKLIMTDKDKDKDKDNRDHTDIRNRFFDRNDNRIKLDDLVDRRCEAVGKFHISNVFIGNNKPAIQSRLDDDVIVTEISPTTKLRKLFLEK